MSLPHTPCIYCGVDLSGGPRAFIKEYSTQERDEKIREMADIILESSNYDSIEDLLSIITDAFDAAEEQDLPEGLGWGQYATNTLEDPMRTCCTGSPCARNRGIRPVV